MLDLALIREELHKIPELAFAEHKTVSFLLAWLEKMSHIQLHTFSFPGIIAVYKHPNAEGEPFTLFRADMDALPLTERTGCSFTSQHEGMMHACGHDIHMTALLGLIDHVNCTQPVGNYLFLFQPAEEGKGGAERVISTGVLDQYAIKATYALHVTGTLPVGSISSKPGIIFAIPQEFDVTITGRSAHVAYRERGCDALQAGISFDSLMRKQLAQHISGMEPVVYHVGKMYAGQVRNSVPATCVMEGTHRTLNKTVHSTVNSLMQETALLVQSLHNVSIQVSFPSTYDPVINHPNQYAAIKQAAERSGIEFVEAETSLTGEDFGFFTTLYPGALFWLGGGDDKHDLHSDAFLPKSSCVDVAIRILKELL